MDNYLSALPSDIKGTILSSANTNEELIEIALLLPNAREKYNEKRNDIEFWLERLDKHLKKPLPLSYIQNPVKLERYHIILNCEVNELFLVDYLPEILDLCDLSNEGYTKQTNVSFIDTFIRTVITFNPTLIAVIAEKPYFDRKMISRDLFQDLLYVDAKKFLALYDVLKKILSHKRLARLFKDPYKLRYEQNNERMELLKERTNIIKRKIPEFRAHFSEITNLVSCFYLKRRIHKDSVLFPELTHSILLIQDLKKLKVFVDAWKVGLPLKHNTLLILLMLTNEEQIKDLAEKSGVRTAISDLEEVLSDSIFDNNFRDIKAKLDTLKNIVNK